MNFIFKIVIIVKSYIIRRTRIKRTYNKKLKMKQILSTTIKIKKKDTSNE